jgi:hypothetical protein
VSVELQKIIVSPWATRAVVQFNPPADARGSRPVPIASVSLPDGSSFNDNFHHDSGTFSEDYFWSDFTDQSGAWTLTLNELVYPPPHGGQPIQTNGPDDTMRLQGPWVFTFEVP